MLPHYYVTSVNIKKFSRLIAISHVRILQVAFSHSSWNNSIRYFDGGL